MSTYIDLIKDYVAFARGSWMELLIYCTIMIVWLWSGCYSASVAEMRLRSPFTHFLLGLLMPIFYPIFILFKMTVYTVPEEKPKIQESVFQRAEGPPPVEMAPAAIADAPPGVVDTQMVDSPDLAFNRSYFRQISMDMSGNYRGPFLFVVKGNEFKVERIMEVFDEMILVEFISSDGKVQNIRIPYKNIESCKEVEAT